MWSVGMQDVVKRAKFRDNGYFVVSHKFITPIKSIRYFREILVEYTKRVNLYMWKILRLDLLSVFDYAG